MLSKVRNSLSILFLIAFFAVSSALAAGLPSSAITAPLNNSALPASLGSYSIKGNAVDNSGAGLKKVEVSFNGGGSWNTATGTTSWSYNWSPLPLGSYSIQSRATDNTNTVGSATSGTHVIVDGSAPSSSITSPTVGSYLKGTSVTIMGTATDTGGSGLLKVEVGITPNGGSTSWYTTAGTSSWTYSWNLPADGGYNIKTKATDNAGNVESVGSGIAVTVDKTPPVVSAGTNKTANASFTQTATATDATAMTYSWTKQAGPGTITFGTPTALSTTISASVDGTYTLRFTATDAAGNSSYSDMTLTWDATAPASSVTAPLANANLIGTSCTISGTASDSGTGLQKMEVGITPNGGSTSWYSATGTTNWTYSWALPANGSYTIKARATDNIGNVQNPVTAVPVSVVNVLATVTLDRSSYNGPMDKGTVTVNDGGTSVTAGPGNDSITVKVISSSDAAGELVTLREDTAVEGRFSGSFGFEPLKAFAGNAKVYVSKGDTVTVTYTDNTTPSGSPQDVTATAAWDCGRATWLSNASDIINNVGTSRTDLFTFCSSPHGNGAASIDTVYLDPAGAINLNPTFLRSFITDAHSHGLRVECLMGAPGWATSSGLATAAAAIDTATSFNDAGAVSERFDGIHLAVDPSLLSNWQTQTASVWSDYMALLSACQGRVNSYNGNGVHDLAMGVDMPAWYDTAYPGITSSDSVQALVDYVVVMARADVTADIESVASRELGYAQNIGKKAFIGVETACGTYPVDATFCEEGYTVMDQRLGNVAQYFQAGKSYMGLGINDYQAYTLLNQLPNSPVTGITDPVANATISGASYMVKGTASSVIGVGKVEVSTDGGAHWYSATDTSTDSSWSTWSYSWTPLPVGSATIKARATDTMGDVETPGASIGVSVVDISKYTLTVAVNGNGTVAPNPAAYYLDGGTVTLTATPSSSCVQFTGWSGDATGTTNPLTVTMHSNKVITANFATIRYHLTTAVNDTSGGSVSAGGDYDCGSMAQVSATANPGYVFTGWSGGATGTANPLSVTMGANISVTANFKRQGINLVYSQSGTSVTLTATMYYNGSPVSGKKINFYDQTGTGSYASMGTVNTNTSGVAVKTFTSAIGNHHAYASFTVVSGSIPSMQSNTVAYTIGKVILASPASGSVATSPTPNLSWQAYSGATLYHVQVATSTKFGTGTLSATATGTSVTSPMTLIHGRTYYWRAYADIPTGTTVFSDTWLMSY